MPKSYISTCMPSSTTRLGAKPKNAVARWALRARMENSRARHRAIPGFLPEHNRFAAQEKGGALKFELQPVAGTFAQKRWYIGLFHKAVKRRNAIEIGLEPIHFDSFCLLHAWFFAGANS